MPDHIYKKTDLIRRLEAYLGRTFETIDNRGLFNQVQAFNLQKGIVGAVVEQCIFEYPPDSKQEADLIIIDGPVTKKTELKTTGMVIELQPMKHYVAKEPMSITAVGVYDIAEQDFETSHFWDKLEHMLIIYYHYAADHAVSAYEYKDFPLVGYEFHEFSSEDVQVLRRDWEYVRALCADVVSHHPGPRNAAWKTAVKEEYINVHGQLRRVLSYIDLAPKFPPRFRLKKPTVSTIISKHFGYELEQLPGRYTAISDIDQKCHELTEQYRGWTLGQLADYFGIAKTSPTGTENKGISEQIIIAMFGGTSKKLNQIELFNRFGLIGKTVAMTSAGGRTEDMKLFRVDFEEIARTSVTEEDGSTRPIQFEDSDLYSYFADHEFLCILFQEPDKEYEYDQRGKRVEKKHPLISNTFLGFKRLVFSDTFIDTKVKALWIDTRNKVISRTLVDVIQRKKDGSVIINKTGSISTALNLMKGADNEVFIKCSATDTSEKYKTVQVNGMHILPQYVWIKGTSVVEELALTPEL